MSFSIDKIKFTRTSAVALYNLEGESNPNGPGNNPLPSGTLSSPNKDLQFDFSGISTGDKVHFSHNNIDFSAYGRRDMLYIIFDDGAGKEEQGGICIRDTDYPPPNRPKEIVPLSNKAISEKFVVTMLECIRSGADDFTVNINLSFDDPQSDYTMHSIQILPDPGNNISAVVMRVNEINDGSPHTGTLNFTISSNIRLGDHSSRGLPFIVTDLDLSDPANWAGINTKKILAFIS